MLFEKDLLNFCLQVFDSEKCTLKSFPFSLSYKASHKVDETNAA